MRLFARTVPFAAALLLATGALAQAPTTRAPAGKALEAPQQAPPSVTSRNALPSATRSAAPMSGNEFATEAEAKQHCPSDTVVWANLGGSKAYHMSGAKYYGKTKKGAYMCQKDADSAGFHAAGQRKPKKG